MLQMPTEITHDTVNYTLLANRDVLQIRNGVIYTEIFGYAKDLHQGIMEEDEDLVAESRVKLIQRILMAIHNNEGQHQRLAEWALQAFCPDAIETMLVKEGKEKKNKRAEADAKAKQEAAELAEAKQHDAEIKASYES